MDSRLRGNDEGGVARIDLRLPGRRAIIVEDDIAVAAEARPAEVAQLDRIVIGRILEDVAIERNDEPAVPRRIIEQSPGHRMKTLADAEKAAERHDRIEHPP